jgi:hypothetical protein
MGTKTKLLSGLVVAGLVLGSGAFGAGFAAACNGSLDTFPTIAAAQRDLNPNAAPAGSAQPSGTSAEPAGPLTWLKAIPRAVGYTLLTELLRFKRNDAIVYPAHVWLARGVTSANCKVDAVRLQWLKAGIHASEPEQVDEVALGLEATIHSEADRALVKAAVRSTAERESWSLGAVSLRARVAPEAAH